MTWTGQVVEQLPVGVTLTTYDGRLLQANPEAYRLLGLQRGEIVNVCGLYVDAKQRQAVMNEVRRNQRTNRFEVQLLVRGEPVLFRAVCVAFENGAGTNGVILSAFWMV